MNKEYINTILLAILFLLLFGIAELLYYKFHVKADTTRKVVHLGTGLLCLLFPSMLHSHWFVFFLCFGFAVILFASLKFNLLKSINAIERVSYGSLLYPLIIYICFLIYNYFNNNYIYFYLPLLIMSICDPFAAIIGKRWPYGKFYIRKDNKTIMGSAAFFISSSIITLILFYFLLPNSDKFLITFSVALSATLAEALFVKGFDNFTIPLSVIMILIVLHV